jgi:hypothetical protein
MEFKVFMTSSRTYGVLGAWQGKGNLWDLKHLLAIG